MGVHGLLLTRFHKYLPEKIRFRGSEESSSFQSLLSSLAILALALSLRSLRLSIGSRRVKWEKGGGDFSTALRPLLPALPFDRASIEMSGAGGNGEIQVICISCRVFNSGFTFRNTALMGFEIDLLACLAARKKGKGVKGDPITSLSSVCRCTSPPFVRSYLNPGALLAALSSLQENG